MSIVFHSWCVNMCALCICSLLLKKKNPLKRKTRIRQMIKKIDVNNINIRKHKMLGAPGWCSR